MKLLLIYIGLAFLPFSALAHHTPTTIVNVTEVTEVTEVYDYSTTITSGISESDLAAGLSAAMAIGSHQFDFGTYDWQGSITGAWESDEWENAYSFGIGKRFRKMDALFHGAFTQSNSTEYVVFGGTFRF